MLILRFSILGPLTVIGDDGRQLSLKALKLRMLLAILVADADRVVPVDQLVAGLWECPPRTATSAVQVYVSKLRRILAEGAKDKRADELIVTDAPGYLLRLAGHSCDSVSAFAYRDQAGTAEAAGELAEASALLSKCLDLWSGPALADVRIGSRLNRVAKRLDEERINVYERRIVLDLRLGRHRALVGELYSLIEEHPSWEPIYSYLMIALHRSGRTTDALAVYAQMRGRFVDQYGIEPGAAIRRLHQLVLRRDPALNELSLTPWS